MRLNFIAYVMSFHANLNALQSGSGGYEAMLLVLAYL